MTKPTRKRSPQPPREYLGRDTNGQPMYRSAPSQPRSPQPLTRAYYTSGAPTRGPRVAPQGVWWSNGKPDRLEAVGPQGNRYTMSRRATTSYIKANPRPRDWATEARGGVKSFEKRHGISPKISPAKDYTNTHGGVGKPKAPAPGRRYQ